MKIDKFYVILGFLWGVLLVLVGAFGGAAGASAAGTAGVATAFLIYIWMLLTL